MVFCSVRPYPPDPPISCRWPYRGGGARFTICLGGQIQLGALGSAPLVPITIPARSSFCRSRRHCSRQACRTCRRSSRRASIVLVLILGRPAVRAGQRRLPSPRGSRGNHKPERSGDPRALHKTDSIPHAHTREVGAYVGFNKAKNSNGLVPRTSRASQCIALRRPRSHCRVSHARARTPAVFFLCPEASAPASGNHWCAGCAWAARVPNQLVENVLGIERDRSRRDQAISATITS